MSIRLALPALALATLAPAGTEELAFHAAEGTELVRTVRTAVEMELDEMVMTLDGEELPHGDAPELELLQDEQLVVRDLYGPPGDGRPERLERSYEELTGEHHQTVRTPNGDQEMSRDSGSELEGLTVVFTWDADEEEFVAAWGDEAGDDELLDGLVEDMDMRAFLPAGAVEEGESWDVDPSEFLAVREPGGIALHGEDDSPVEAEIDEQLNAGLDGEIRATFEGLRDEDGVEVAVVSLSVDLETEGSGEEENGSERTVEMAMELEGELLWDVAAGHLHGLVLEGSTNVNMLVLATMDRGQGEQTMEQSMSFSGAVTYTVTVERASGDE